MHRPSHELLLLFRPSQWSGTWFPGPPTMESFVRSVLKVSRPRRMARNTGSDVMLVKGGSIGDVSNGWEIWK